MTTTNATGNGLTRTWLARKSFSSALPGSSGGGLMGFGWPPIGMLSID